MVVAASVMFLASIIQSNKKGCGYSAGPCRRVSSAGRAALAGENFGAAVVLGAAGRPDRDRGAMAEKWRFFVGAMGGVGRLLSVWFQKGAYFQGFAGQGRLIGNLSRAVSLAALGGGRVDVGGPDRRAGSPPSARPPAYSTPVASAGQQVGKTVCSGPVLALISRINPWLRGAVLEVWREFQGGPMGSGVRAARESQVKRRLAGRPNAQIFGSDGVGVQNRHSYRRMVKRIGTLCLPQRHVK
jgi:hypothetical protein